MKKLRKKI